MRRFFNVLLAIGVVAGAVLLAAFLISLAPEPEQRELPSPLPFVTTAPVTAGSGSIPVYGAGTVRPSAEIDIAPQVGGRVVWVDPALRSGGRIEAGQTMFRIADAVTTADLLHRRTAFGFLQYRYDLRLGESASSHRGLLAGLSCQKTPTSDCVT